MTIPIKQYVKQIVFPIVMTYLFMGCAITPNGPTITIHDTVYIHQPVVIVHDTIRIYKSKDTYIKTSNGPINIGN